MNRKQFIASFLKSQSISYSVYSNGKKIKEVVGLKDIKIANEQYIHYKLCGYQIRILE